VLVVLELLAVSEGQLVPTLSFQLSHLLAVAVVALELRILPKLVMVELEVLVAVVQHLVRFVMVVLELPTKVLLGLPQTGQMVQNQVEVEELGKLHRLFLLHLVLVE
jgi:hypothetical protein